MVVAVLTLQAEAERLACTQGEGGVLLNDMWEWHMDTLHWSPLADFQTAGGHRSAASCHTCCTRKAKEVK